MGVMIYFLNGKLSLKGGNFVVIETGGIGFKVFIPESVSKGLPLIGEDAKLFTHYYLREDAALLYGFLTAEDLEIFEMLISVSGVGPKTALGVLNLTTTANLLAAIKEGRAELLTRASGIGRKTAERLILELKEKIKSHESKDIVSAMEGDADVLSALQNLGYLRSDAQDVLRKIDPAVKGVPSRLREALRLLKK